MTINNDFKSNQSANHEIQNWQEATRQFSLLHKPKHKDNGNGNKLKANH